MCGIVGLHLFSNQNFDIVNGVKMMNQIQNHRGPDQDGTYLDEINMMALSMRRLSIIDIESGIQPMISECERYVLVYNGEIFNAPELRRNLEKEGEIFNTDHSDTEVLFKLLIKYQEHKLHLLNGMFSFSFYDKKENKLLIGRDRSGIKPLYYTKQNGVFAFSSEIKSLLTLPIISKTINKQSLFHYLSLMYVPGEYSIIENIKKLKPGYILKYNLVNNQVTTIKLLDISFQSILKISNNELNDNIYNTFLASVKRWSYSDVPISCALSGGLDSSSILGALAKLNINVKTYSLGFKEDIENKFSDLYLSGKIADHWGFENEKIILEPNDLIKNLNKMVWALDEPYGGGLPSWFVFEEMSKSFKVGLTGTGGDELFGNYGKWRTMDGNFFRISKSDKKSFRRKFFDIYYYFNDDLKRNYLLNDDDVQDTSAFLFDEFDSINSLSLIDKIAKLDFKTQLPEEFLLMTDRFSMFHSLEIRTPFLDNDFVDLIYSIPSSKRTRYSNLKYLLKDSLGSLIPDSIINVPKQGFTLPLDKWLRIELRDLVVYYLGEDFLVKQGIFNKSLYEEIILPYLDDDSTRNTTRIFGLFMFQLWYSQFLDNSNIKEPISYI
jgi:asparagine synthase (glutamine-hydrolysing)